MRRLLIPFVIFFAAGELFASDLAWHATNTEHFTFIYRAEYEYAAGRLVALAEDVYGRVSGFVGSYPEHVDVVIYGETDLSNGYYTPAPPQHVGLYIAHPSLPFMGARTADWYRSLLTHELTHYVQATYRKGIFNAIGMVFGRSISGALLGLMPTWSSEGLAVNAETRLATGGRGTDPFFEMQFRAMVIEGRITSLAQAGFPAYHAPAGRRYPIGYTFWDYLLDTYGNESLPALMDRFSAWPFFGMWGPSRAVFDAPLMKAYDTMNADLRRHYADRFAMVPAERITPAIRSDYYIPQETGRGLYVYRTRTDRLPAIVDLDPQTGSETVVLNMRLTDKRSWSASADGRLIAFATIDVDGLFPDEQAEHSNLFLYDVDSRSTRRLTSSRGFVQPAIAPDGGSIVAVHYLDGICRLSRISVTDGDVHPLLKLPETTFTEPRFSPDGSRLAVIANHRGDARLLVIDVANGRYHVLPTVADGLPYAPTFADNDTILYGDDRGDNLAVYRTGADARPTPDGSRAGAPDPIATDPVGAYAATRVGSSLFVATYTADGCALRRIPYPAEGTTTGTAAASRETVAGTQTRSETEPATAIDSWPVSASTHESALVAPPLESRRFFPLALPVVWAPSLSLAGPGLDPTGFGAGVFLYGADLLGRSVWQAQARYYPAYTQLDYGVDWTTLCGRWGVSLSAQSAFSVVADMTPVAVQQFTESAWIDHYLLARYRLGRADRLALSLGVSHRLAFISDAPFSMTAIGSTSVPLWQNRLVAAAAVAGSTVPTAPARSALAPGRLAGSASVAVPMDAPTFRPAAIVVRAGGDAAIGLGGNHTFGFAPSLTWATNAANAVPLDTRGFGASTDHSASAGMPGRFLASIEYHTPRALTDVALAPSVGITSVEATVFTEATGGYAVVNPALVLDRTISFGVELTTRFWYLIEIPLTLGIAARIDPSDPGSFEFLPDMRLYLTSDLLMSVGSLPQYLRP